jgi:ABC-type transporter Mla MlaB component
VAVLRISVIHDSEETIRLQVEGSLVGPWVDVLRRESDGAISRARTVVLDLERLRFIDAAGVVLLRDLARRVAYLNCSTFISQQLQENNV